MRIKTLEERLEKQEVENKRLESGIANMLVVVNHLNKNVTALAHNQGSLVKKQNISTVKQKRNFTIVSDNDGEIKE